MIGTLTTLALGLAVTAPTEFHVATDGNDDDPGTTVAPFRTLVRAQEVVRERLREGIEGDITVVIHEGTHELDRPLVFGPEDSGTDTAAITYRAEPPGEAVVSGGRRIGGWRNGEGELWVADVPGVRDGTWYFRQLVVNGRRAVRARTPNADADPPYRTLVGAELSEDRSSYTLVAEPGQVAQWGNMEDVEAVVLGNWEITRKRLADVDVESSTMVLAPPHAGGHDAIRPKAGRFYFLENAREFLDAPGEWYLDRTTSEVAYWPLPDEDMAQADTVAPVLTRLLEIRGTADQPVRNVHFDGIRFAHTDWAFPEYGFNGIQSSFHCTPAPGAKGWTWAPWDCTEAAVEWTFARDCSLRNGALEYLGGVGLRVRKGCSGNLIEGNHVRVIGGSGIMVGEDLSGFAWGEETLPDAEVPRGNTVANNLVHACGLDDYGAVGIWVAFTDGTTVAHNLVYDLPYTGISVGFRWDDAPTTCANNVVEHNHVHHVLQALCDGGCIYTLGLQPGTVLRENLLHDAARSGAAQGAPNNGIFFDQGSRSYLVERNVIYATSAEPIRFNQCARDWHTFDGNQLDGQDMQESELATEVAAVAGLEPEYRERLMAEVAPE